MKKLLFFLVVLPSHLLAQTTLSKSSSLPRQGDSLVKQQVEYKDPGPSGLRLVWDFSEQKAVNETYELKYTASNADTIIGTEHRTMYYYHSHSDSLFLLGYENPTTLIKYQKPELLLAYPFPYGRTITDYFDAKGSYCDRFDMCLQGKSVVTADATGLIILPGGDTLRHVLRVHTRKRMAERMNPVRQDMLPVDTLPFVFRRDSIEYHLTNDSLCLEIETWRWYAEGYRYSVFETIKSTIYQAGHASEHFATSFYYPPHEQYYDLTHDPENEEKRTLANDQNGDNPFANGDSELEMGKGKEWAYCMDLDGNLCVGYCIDDVSDVTVALYDLQGRQLSGIHKVTLPPGTYRETISLAHLSKGEYLLRVTVNDSVYGDKILR